MNKQALLKDVEKMSDEAARNREWGSIEIGFSGGVFNVIKKTVTRRFPGAVNGEQLHADKESR